MRIVIIGSGNAAIVLGRKIIAAGHQIVQVISRNENAAYELAKEWKTANASDVNKINADADVYLIAVSDDAIADVAKGLNLQGKVAAHTAASVSKDVLKNATDNYAVFYPLQSLRKEIKTLPEIPLFIDASTEKAKKVLETLGESISPGKVFMISADERMKLHIAAVIVNNFTNHLYHLAEDFCKKEKTDFRYLQPLIEETALRLRQISAESVQTGPAFRSDTETIVKHFSLLQSHPELKKVYAFLSESIAGESDSG